MVAASALLFATKAIIVKCAYPYGVDVVDLLTLRMGFALPAFALIAWIEERRATVRLSAGDAVRAAGLGALGYYLASFLDFEGLRFIGVGLERMVLYVYPTVVVLLSATLHKQRISARLILALVVTYGGVGLTYAGRTLDGPDVALGTLLVLGSALAYAVFVVGSGRMIGRLGSLRFMSVAMSGACAVMLGHFLVAAVYRGGMTLFQQPGAVYGYGLILALFCTIAPSLLMGDGLKRVGAQRFAIISTVGPIGTVVLGWLVLGEAMTPLAGLGILVTVAASLVMGLSKP
jgi:drug/metabolite transporter (DMT)-like permease